MAKKEKPVLTPEEIAAKKLKRKKVWARIGAVACALAITGAIYAVGSKDGPKIVREEPEQVIVKQIVTQPAPAAPTTAAPTTKAPAAPTTAAPTTAA
ncbi:MAG: hypothetical protein E7514_01215, partial [Ruminococcaceae bacterium]|nr:hypothetical protein [Oscillospiraceae bacterium]